MFYLELVSGIRKGELVALRWEDLDVEHRTISVSKQALGGLGKELVVNRPKTENSIRAISIPRMRWTCWSWSTKSTRRTPTSSHLPLPVGCITRTA